MWESIVGGLCVVIWREEDRANGMQWNGKTMGFLKKGNCIAIACENPPGNSSYLFRRPARVEVWFQNLAR